MRCLFFWKIERFFIFEIILDMRDKIGEGVKYMGICFIGGNLDFLVYFGLFICYIKYYCFLFM